MASDDTRPVIYTQDLTAAEWRSLLPVIPVGEFRAQLVDELQHHSPDDQHISIRVDHVIFLDIERDAAIARAERAEAAWRALAEANQMMLRPGLDYDQWRALIDPWQWEAGQTDLPGFGGMP